MTNNWQIYHNTNPKVTIQLPLVLYTHCQKDKPSLTFLNFHQLERQGADIQSKVQELEDLNSSLRERDKVKDDAIAHLSDQLLVLSTRLQELERKQQT
jgi:hypothetical protein